MRVLVYSGTSLVGRQIVERLIAHGIETTVTYRSEKNIPIHFKNNGLIDLIKISHTASSEIKISARNIDYIINSTGAYPSAEVSNDDIVYANIKTANHILTTLDNNRKSLKGIINYSTLSVYGDRSDALISHKTKVNPSDLYGSTKLVCEQILNTVSKFTPVYNLRLPAILGKDSVRAWLPTILAKMYAMEEINVFNSNSFYNSCICVSDLWELTFKLIKSQVGSEDTAFPIGSIPDITIGKIIDTMKDKTNYTKEIKEISNTASTCYVDYSNSLAIGYVPRYTSEVIDEWLKLN